VAIGVLVDRWRWALALAIPAIAAALLIMALVGTPLTIADRRTGTSSAAGGHPETAAAYLSRHYHGGEILADDSAASSVIFASNLDLKQFVTVGSHPFWRWAVASPARNVAWVVSYPGDAVTSDMKAHPDRFPDFCIKFTEGIFERLPCGTMPVAAKGNKTGPHLVAIRAAPTSRAPVSPLLPPASTATTLVPATAAEQSAFKAGQRSCRTRPATTRAPTGAAEQAAFKAGQQWCHSLTTVTTETLTAVISGAAVANRLNSGPDSGLSKFPSLVFRGPVDTSTTNATLGGDRGAEATHTFVTPAGNFTVTRTVKRHGLAQPSVTGKTGKTCHFKQNGDTGSYTVDGSRSTGKFAHATGSGTYVVTTLAEADLLPGKTVCSANNTGIALATGASITFKASIRVRI
jgi:hypothetical protein